MSRPATAALCAALLFASAGGAAAELPARSSADAPAAAAEAAQPLWLRDGSPTPQARALAEILRTADAQGLEPDDYDGPLWGERFSQLAQAHGAAALAKLDAELSASARRYVKDLAEGRVDPRALHWQLGEMQPRLDVQSAIESLAQAPDVPAALAALEPKLLIYRRTLRALQQYREAALHDTGGPLPAWKKVISPGDEWPGAAQLAQRLSLTGDLASSAAAQTAMPALYSEPLVAAVEQFQRRHGLTADGRIDRRTWKALSVPLRARAVQLQLALERLRWIPRDLAAPLLAVNIPEFRLRALDASGHVALAMKVVVGRAYQHKTPVFSAKVESVLFRPPWNVPADIVRKELGPEFSAHPERAEAQGFELVDGKGAPVEMSPAALARAASGELRLRQRAGPHSALGLIKFELPNRFEVYLHDTPATELFSRTRRDFSHGCIRLEDAAALARWVLRDTPGWTPERQAAAMAAEESERATLAQPLPVLILYSTAVVAEGGEVQFFDDLYQHDARLLRALAARRRGAR